MSPNIASRVDSIVMETPADGTSRRSTGRSSQRAAGSPDVDPESLARAREAALKDDYEWYMEFIEGNDDVDVDVVPTPNFDSSDMNEKPWSRGSTRQTRVARDGESSRDPSAGGASYGDRRRGKDSRVDSAGESWPRPEDQTYNPARRRRRDARAYPPSAVEGGARPRRKISVPADSAYDYDLDDEFAEEPGQGGWAYDPDLTAGVAERRRGVDVSRVRSRARAAAQRRPLPQDLGAADGDDGEGKGAEAGKEGVTEDAGVSPPSTLSPEKVSVLTGELGYTEDEASRIDPYMADLAIQRRLRRPSSGMPPDWAAGAPGARDSGLDDAYADVPGALDLDEILSRERGTVTDRREARASEGMVGDRPRDRTRGWKSYREEDEDEGDYSMPSARRRKPSDYDRRGTGYGYGPDDYGYYDTQSSRVGRRGPEDRARGRQRRRLDPAEKYERRLRGWDDDDEERSIWTGVGDEGPWPTLEEFTRMLRDETDVRLSIVGPWAADIVAAENRFRLNAYEKWLEILDKGIGESLLDAGLFDAGVYDEDEAFLYDEDDGRGGRIGPDYRRRRDARGTAPGARGSLDGDDGGRARRGRRRSGPGALSDRGMTGDSGFDVGDFLRSSAEKLTSPAPGMEEQAARFEREYPGRRRPSLARERQTDGSGGRRTDRPTAMADGARRREGMGAERSPRDGGKASPSSRAGEGRPGYPSNVEGLEEGELEDDDPYGY